MAAALAAAAAAAPSTRSLSVAGGDGAAGAAAVRVGRNLVVRFVDDGIDQSAPLAGWLKERFVDETTGIGGRLDFRRLPGTHVTPNMPTMRGLDWELVELANGLGLGGGIGGDVAAQAKAIADQSSFEQAAACAAVAQFALQEARKASEPT